MKRALTRFLVLGSGAWGSALAIYLAQQGHAVVQWGHDAKSMAIIAENRMNERYLPGVVFPSNVTFCSDLAKGFELAGNNPIVLIVVPSAAFADVTQQIQPFLTKTTRIVSATKGLAENGQLLSVICRQNCGLRPFAVLSGPSFAKEVAEGLPTAVTIATESSILGEQLVKAFHSDVFRVYLSHDLIGVQLGGIFKNVLAIGVGMSDGLGFGANARAGLITRGLAEMCRLGEKMGAQLSTLMGLSGVGDMVLTCTDNQSRNRRFGLALGQGMSCQAAEHAIGQVVEGKMNVRQLIALAKKYQTEIPICEQVNAVLYENLLPEKAVANLLQRTPKAE